MTEDGAAAMSFRQSGNTYSVTYDEHNQTMVFAGSMRPKHRDELEQTRQTLQNATEKDSGILYMDFKKLDKMNNIAFLELAACLRASLRAQ